MRMKELRKRYQRIVNVNAESGIPGLEDIAVLYGHRRFSDFPASIGEV